MTFQFIRFSIHRPTIANSRNRDKNRLEIRALNYQILVPSLLAPSDNPRRPRSREFRKTRLANSRGAGRQRRIDLDRSRQSIKTLAGDYFVRLRSRSFIRCPPLMENYSAPLINDRNVVNNKKNYHPVYIIYVHSCSKIDKKKKSSTVRLF